MCYRETASRGLLRDVLCEPCLAYPAVSGEEDRAATVRTGTVECRAQKSAISGSARKSKSSINRFRQGVRKWGIVPRPRHPVMEYFLPLWVNHSP